MRCCATAFENDLRGSMHARKRIFVAEIEPAERRRAGRNTFLGMYEKWGYHPQGSRGCDSLYKFQRNQELACTGGASASQELQKSGK